MVIGSDPSSVLNKPQVIQMVNATTLRMFLVVKHLSFAEPVIRMH